MDSRRLGNLAIVLFISTSLSCTSPQGDSARGSPHPSGSQEKTAKQVPTIDDASEITPLADGCAYASVPGGEVWYVCGTRATRVPLTDGIDELQADANGGAFGSAFGKGLWYLKGATATRIVEVPEAVSLGATQPGPVDAKCRGYWTLLEAERKRGKKNDEIDADIEDARQAANEYQDE